MSRRCDLCDEPADVFSDLCRGCMWDLYNDEEPPSEADW